MNWNCANWQIEAHHWHAHDQNGTKLPICLKWRFPFKFPGMDGFFRFPEWNGYHCLTVHSQNGLGLLPCMLNWYGKSHDRFDLSVYFYRVALKWAIGRMDEMEFQVRMAGLAEMEGKRVYSVWIYLYAFGRTRSPTPSVVFSIPPDGSSPTVFPSVSHSSPLSIEAFPNKSATHPSPSFHAPVSIPASDSSLSEGSIGSFADSDYPRLVSCLLSPPNSVILPLSMAFDVSSRRVSEVRDLQVVNHPCSDLVPISDGVADIANLDIKIEYQWKPTRGSHCNRKGHAEPQGKPAKVFKPTGRILLVSQPIPSQPNIKKKNHVLVAPNKADPGSRNLPISNAFDALRDTKLECPIVDSNVARNREVVVDELL
ncbi:hypothetical protein Nepgr_017499 [Nepenthes gracilis]|uniref:Uncharacterized protein n=1 Tax=Nepenthes gracilis TaxID=150966 RepID=A0AAD3XSI8_NEPGR|nr:hypothetical protein Nepgr_017499 [Nepenthes gracilis]